MVSSSIGLACSSGTYLIAMMLSASRVTDVLYASPPTTTPGSAPNAFLTAWIMFSRLTRLPSRSWSTWALKAVASSPSGAARVSPANWSPPMYSRATLSWFSRGSPEPAAAASAFWNSVGWLRSMGVAGSWLTGGRTRTRRNSGSMRHAPGRRQVPRTLGGRGGQARPRVTWGNP
ncbi:hypothetical protein ACFQ0B_35300 [Nonomuraea thailandensis]